MNATDVLSNEHRAVELVLMTMEKFADRLDSTEEELDTSIVEDSLEFASGFVDRCHHAKEEELLFPLLVERGVRKDGGPIGAMLHEHNESRGMIAWIRENLDKWTAGDDDARPALAEAMRCYAALMRSHIFKEDEVLFVAAEAAISDEDNEHLIKEFNEIEERKIGPGVHERYHKMLDNLLERSQRI